MRRGKRAFDIFASGAGLVLLSPFLLIIAVLISVQDGGGAIFAQKRIGRDGKPFRMFKFRSMVLDAERRGLQLTVGEDQRITRIGRWLRKLKFDELPQLFNVLRGEMSLVGPRPEVPRYVELYDEQQKQVLQLLPGITDPASIAYANESEILAQSSNPEAVYINRIVPDKIRLNLEYAKAATLWSDVMIILGTFRKVAESNPRAGVTP